MNAKHVYDMIIVGGWPGQLYCGPIRGMSRSGYRCSGETDGLDPSDRQLPLL